MVVSVGNTSAAWGSNHLISNSDINLMLFPTAAKVREGGNNLSRTGRLANKSPPAPQKEYLEPIA